MAPKNKRGTTAKGETLTIRLEPKLKWGIELLARKHKRTMSSVIEWAIINAINSHEGLNITNNKTTVNTLDLAWDVDESDRIIKLAIHNPSLLTYEEEVIWKLIKENKYFWHEKGTDKKNILNMLNLERIRKNWEKLTKVATGKTSKDTLPKADLFSD